MVLTSPLSKKHGLISVERKPYTISALSGKRREDCTCYARYMRPKSSVFWKKCF